MYALDDIISARSRTVLVHCFPAVPSVVLVEIFEIIRHVLVSVREGCSWAIVTVCRRGSTSEAGYLFKQMEANVIVFKASACRRSLWTR